MSFSTIFVVYALCFFSAGAHAQNTGLLWRSSPELARFHIVIPENATPLIRQAGSDFRRLWKLSTRRPISISPVNEGMTNVWLGRQTAASEMFATEDASSLSAEAFVVRTYTPPRRDAERGACKQLLISGGSDFAVLQGVYAFFGEQMGVSWLEPGVEYAPKPPDGIREIDTQYHPEFSIREIALLALYKAGTREFRLGNKLSPEALCSPGNVDFFDSCLAEVPVAILGDNVVPLGNEQGTKRLYEEICALASSSRSEGASLRDTCSWNVGKDTVWLVSAMAHLKPVLSAEGQTLNKAEESPVAAILHSLNGAATRLEQAFPNETHFLHVLLSPATQQPPLNLRPHRKVIVQLSTQDCDFFRPYSDAESPENARFADALTRWTRFGSPVHVLDFLTNQRDPQLPFPCTDVVHDNVLFFARKGVHGIYYAGTAGSSSGHVDLLPFKTFLAARSLCDPDLSPEQTRKLFLTGYYGAAAPTMEEYLAMLRDAFTRSASILRLEDEGTWISTEMLAAATALFESVLAGELPEPYRGRVIAAASTINHCRELRGLSGISQ